LSDGSGFDSITPPNCTAADGAALTFASATDVQTALAGTWYDCGATGNSVLQALGGGELVSALQLTADGHYVLFGPPTGGNAAASDVLAAIGSVEMEDGGRTGAPVTSTYQVVDASAALGTGAFQIEFQIMGGGTLIAQVLVLQNPTKIRFVYANGPSTEEFAPALPMTFRAGVCTYQDGDDFGPAVSSLSDAEIASRLEGHGSGAPTAPSTPAVWGSSFLVTEPGIRFKKTPRAPYPGAPRPKSMGRCR
jgi:hypothetical protein